MLYGLYDLCIVGSLGNSANQPCFGTTEIIFIEMLFLLLGACVKCKKLKNNPSGFQCAELIKNGYRAECQYAETML